MSVLLLLIGLAAGGAIGFLLGKHGPAASQAAPDQEIEALRVEIAGLKSSHEAELERLGSEATLKAASVEQLHRQEVTSINERHSIELAGLQTQITAQAQEFEQLRTQEVESLKEKHAVETAGLRTQMESQAEEFEARKKLMEANRKQLSEEMESISNAVLGKTAKRLEETLEDRRKQEAQKASTELEKRTVEIKNAVRPVGEKLDEVNRKVESLEKERSKAQGQLGEQIQSLRKGVDQLAGRAEGLTAALKKPSGRGSWGEVQLRNVIELSGMLEYCDFVSQVVVKDVEGKLIPDVVVNMPGGNQVIVDAKAPMDAFLDAQDAETEEERDRELVRHARQVKDHINKLRAKNYQDQFDTSPELVVMFIPSEGIYHAALAADPRLLEHGIREKVLVATPTTLIGLLRAIGYGWGQERIAESAQEIASIGKELHRRIVTFSGPLASVGKSLTSAVNNYNKAIASYDSRVVPQLRKIEDAGAKSSKDLNELNPVEGSTRTITSASIEDEASPGEIESSSE